MSKRKASKMRFCGWNTEWKRGRETVTTIRIATEADAEEILAIYAKYIEQTAITFEYDVPSIEEFRGRPCQRTGGFMRTC